LKTVQIKIEANQQFELAEPLERWGLAQRSKGSVSQFMRRLLVIKHGARSFSDTPVTANALPATAIHFNLY